eukprot:29380-Pelagococcus_subviridis.AAC.26
MSPSTRAVAAAVATARGVFPKTWLVCLAINCGNTHCSERGTPMASDAARTLPGFRIATACHRRHIRTRSDSSSSVYRPWSRRTIWTSSPPRPPRNRPRRVVVVVAVVVAAAPPPTSPPRPPLPPPLSRFFGCLLTIMFPGCGSPCTNPWHASMRANVSASASAAAVGSIPAALNPGPSSTLTPRTYSIVNTRGVVSDQYTFGVTIRGSSASALPVRSHDRPSHTKSSSRARRWRNSGTRNEKSNAGNANFTAFVMNRIVARSTSNCLLSPGRWTFTATSSPAAVTARWTCAKDAAAMGSLSNETNTPPPPPPPKPLKPPTVVDASIASLCRTSLAPLFSAGALTAAATSTASSSGGIPSPFRGTMSSTALLPSSSATTSRTLSQSSGRALSCSFDSCL